MGRGKSVLQVRVPDDLYWEIVAEMAKRNEWTRREPWDISGFLRAAIREFIRYRKAGRRPRPNRRKGKGGAS